jgi:hypothetical protein
MKKEQFAVRSLASAVQGALIAMFALPFAAAAADGEASVATLTQPTSSIEIGVENVSKTSAKFGEYNGLNKSGAELIGNFGVRGGDGYHAYDGGMGTTRWEIKGTDLGTTSREISGTAGSQGQWNLGIGYDELRHYITDSYQTPYPGAMGGSSFVLPAAFGVIDTNAAGVGTQGMSAGQLTSFRTVDVHTERKNTTFKAGYIFDRQLSFQFDYKHLDQSGAKLVSAASDGTGGGAGENAVTLMNPTNYKTDTFDLGLTWIGDSAHLTASYFASIFKDGYSSLSWSNPFYNGGGGTTGTAPLEIGRAHV